MLNFVGKHLPNRFLFIFCIFYLNEKELNQQVYLIKYVENEISYTLRLTKKKKERERERERERRKNITQLQKHF